MKVSQRPVTTVRRKSAEVGSHHKGDIVGVVMLSLSLVIAISLLVANTGFLGGLLGSLFREMFGRGAWGVPIIFAGVGFASLSGRRELGFPSFTWGLLLIYLALLGLFASPGQAQDFFNPESIRTSGGYLGAVIGWGFSAMLGAASWVGLLCLMAVGLILSGNRPVASLLQSMSERASTAAGRVRAREKPVKAVIRATAQERTIVPVDADVAPSRPRPAPIIRDMVAPKESPTPSFSTSTAKEGYQLPPMNLLAEPAGKQKRSQQEMQRNIETLESTLEEFGIDANVVEVATGPTITRYEIQLGPGIRVARITALADNIAMNLAASQVRVEAPIPGKAAIGVEVPNAQATAVSLREVCDIKEFRDHASRLCVALGQDVSGINKFADLTRMPHLLIGGATNSGKSIGLATLITSLLMRNTPKDLRFVMIDPKRVELSLFDQIPHLLCPVIKDVKEAPGVLRAVWREMDRRYDLFSAEGVRNIDGWNEKASFQDKLPFIVVVIDELADLMIQASAEVETSICRLAQLARATGIHLVIATQRPSVDVITGTIKANIASRIAFTVSSQIDSRTILDQKGAETLIGRGDMLFLPIDAGKPVRVQGCYVSEKEIDAVCTFWRNQEPPQYAIDPAEYASEALPGGLGPKGSTGQVDALWEDAVRFVADRGEASTSMLQRRFSIGFQRASRLLDEMEARNIVGPRDGPRPREVLVSPGDADSLFGGTPYGDTGWIDEEPN